MHTSTKGILACSQTTAVCERTAATNVDWSPLVSLVSLLADLGASWAPNDRAGLNWQQAHMRTDAHDCRTGFAPVAEHANVPGLASRTHMRDALLPAGLARRGADWAQTALLHLHTVDMLPNVVQSTLQWCLYSRALQSSLRTVPLHALIACRPGQQQDRLCTHGRAAGGAGAGSDHRSGQQD